MNNLDKFFIAWLNKMPDWVITISSLVFILIIIAIAWQLITATKRYVDATSREEKLISLLEEKQQLTNEINITTTKELQYAATIKKLTSNIDTYNKQIFHEDTDYVPFINQILETISFDISGNSNHTPRCGFWIANNENGTLDLLFNNHGYGKLVQEKQLLIDRSIAGRSYRRGEVINTPDVSTDGDWEKGYISKYKALICIPIGDIGVLTIDSLYPLDDMAESVGIIYSHLLNGVFIHLINDIEEATTEIIEEEAVNI